MQCYICAADFVYLRDKHGTPYGWGVAKYAAPEALFGEEFVTSAYVREPRESLERLTRQLSRMLPGIPPEQLAVFLKG